MKHFLLSVFLCLLSTFFYAQKDKTVYLDSIGEETDYANHMTSLLIKDFDEEKKQYNIYEYYKLGKLKSEGVCSNKWTKTKEGIFSTYYETGNLKSRTMYDKELPYGEFIQWYENGSKKTEGEHMIFEDEDGKKTSESFIKNYWNENNVQKVFNGNGTYTENNKTESASGELRNGRKEGLWECKSTSAETNNQLVYSETYKKGKLISGTSFDKKNNQINYTELQINAIPQKGITHFYRSISGKVDTSSIGLSYSPIKLMASFIIDKEGKISDVKIIYGSAPNVNASLESALLKYPNWKPALQRGLPVRSKFTLPVTIQVN